MKKLENIASALAKEGVTSAVIFLDDYDKIYEEVGLKDGTPIKAAADIITAGKTNESFTSIQNGVTITCIKNSEKWT